MIEYVVEGYSDDDALAIGYGLSITFRRALVVARPSPQALAAVRSAWGALLIKPCPSGLPCFDSLEDAVEASEAEERPVGYEGPVPEPRPYRPSTFNKHYLAPWRWASGGEEPGVGHPLLPLFSCLYTLLKARDDVPVVVSDVMLRPSPARPDYMVTPTWHMPQLVQDVVDVHAPPLSAAAIAVGILRGGYQAGPVIAIARRHPLLGELRRLGGYAVVLDEPGDPCRLFEEGQVGYRPPPQARYVVDPDLCDRCGDCLKTGCPAIAVSPKGHPTILDVCNGCGACAIACTRSAIRPHTP